MMHLRDNLERYQTTDENSDTSGTYSVICQKVTDQRYFGLTDINTTELQMNFIVCYTCRDSDILADTFQSRNSIHACYSISNSSTSRV